MPEEYHDGMMTQELFMQMIEEDEPITWKRSIDSFFLNGNSGFGTIWLFVLVYEEYRKGEIIWAEIKFKINGPRWLFNWWEKRVKPDTY